MKKFIPLFLLIPLVVCAGLIYAPIPNTSVRVLQYRVRAAFGDKVALRMVGWMYANGWQLPKDDAKAVACYRKASEKGYAEAQVDLAYMYMAGRGVSRDYGQAGDWFRKAADQGNARAQNAIGSMYNSGDGFPKDERQALYWYRLSAAQGNNGGENDLAWFYATCDDQTLRNPEAALRYAQKAVRDTEEYPSPGYIDTLAEAYYVNGQYGNAVATEQRALDLLPKSMPADKRKEYEDRFEKYRLALKANPESAGKGDQ